MKADKLAKADPALAVQVAHGEVSLPKALAQVEAKKKATAKPQKPKAVKPGKPAAKKKAAPAQPTEAEKIAEEAHGDTNLVDELERTHAELLQAQELLKAAEADDQKAETLKWRRMYDNACRQQAEAMERAAGEIKRHAETKRWLMRCGQAVGEEDPRKIPAAVEMFVKSLKVAA